MTGYPDPFSDIALAYDREFTRLPEVMRLRRKMYAALQAYLPPPARVLELGCGTAEDALQLNTLGYEVIATDSSSGMLEVARQKSTYQQVPLLLVQTPIEHIRTFRPCSFDAVFSNFGALNCVERIDESLCTCNGLLKPGGVMILCLINRHSLWETVGFLLRLQPLRAVRRWRLSGTYVPVGKQAVLTWYHSAGAIRSALRLSMEIKRIIGLNIISPPPGARTFSKNHPRILHLLQHIEKWIEAVPPFSLLGDHYVVVLKKKQTRSTVGE